MPPTEQTRANEAPATADIALPDQHGRETRLADFRGKPLVLYFYPMDDTPGCTVEGKEFRVLHPQFVALGCAVVGVSVDSVESHRAFAAKHGLPFALLSDWRGELARAFGVLREGVAARSTFVLDRESRIARAFLDVSPRGHAQQVLNFARSMLESHRMIGG